MEEFKLCYSPICLFYQEIKSVTNEAVSLKKELKIKSSEVLCSGLDWCNKMKAVTANSLKSQNGTLFSPVWRRGRLALDPL